MKHSKGGSMGTQPGAAGGWAMKPRRAQTLASSQPWCCIHSQDMGHHVCMCVCLTQCCGFVVFGFFLSSVVFLTFIMHPFTAWTLGLCISEWEYPKEGACFGGPWVSVMLGLRGQPSMGWVCPTSHTDHGRGLPFPVDLSWALDTMMPRAVCQGLKTGCFQSSSISLPCSTSVLSQTVSPAPGHIPVGWSSPSGWRQSERGARASASSSCSQALLCPRTGMSATAPVWDIKGCSSCLVFCFEILILDLGFRCHAPHLLLVLGLVQSCVL